MQELSGGIFRLPLKRTEYQVEYAFITEDMWFDNIAIRHYEFMAEFETKTVIAIRYCDGDMRAEYEVYWGEKLAPIQTYRIIKDLFDLYDKLLYHDFLDVVTTHLSKGGFASNDNEISLDARMKLANDITDFFERVKISKAEYGLDF